MSKTKAFDHTKYDWDTLFIPKAKKGEEAPKRFMEFMPLDMIKVITCDTRLTPAARQVLIRMVLSTDNDSRQVRLSKRLLSDNFARLERTGQFHLYLMFDPVSEREVNAFWLHPDHVIQMAKRGFPQEDLDTWRENCERDSQRRAEKRKAQQEANASKSHLSVVHQMTDAIGH